MKKNLIKIVLGLFLVFGFFGTSYEILADPGGGIQPITNNDATTIEQLADPGGGIQPVPTDSTLQLDSGGGI